MKKKAKTKVLLKKCLQRKKEDKVMLLEKPKMLKITKQNQHFNLHISFSVLSISDGATVVI